MNKKTKKEILGYFEKSAHLLADAFQEFLWYDMDYYPTNPTGIYELADTFWTIRDMYEVLESWCTRDDAIEYYDYNLYTADEDSRLALKPYLSFKKWRTNEEVLEYVKQRRK